MKRFLNALSSNTAAGPLLGLFAVIAFFAVGELVVHLIQAVRQGESIWSALQQYETHFLAMSNFRTVLVQTCTVAMAALGMTVIIMAGGIDLSAGYALSLAATVLAYMLEKKYGVSIAIVSAVLTGAITGLLNGSLISLLRLTPFIVTLGTMTFYFGFAKLISHEIPIRPPREIIPIWLINLTSPNPKPAWQLLPLSVWMTLVMALLMSGLMNLTVFGRHVRAVGSNEPTAILCGIRVVPLKICVYTLAGVLIGLASMFQFSRLSTGNPSTGVGLELKMIAAVVIGGGSLSGGRGSMMGTMIGACITSVIANGCSMLKFGNPLQDMVLGVIIVTAVWIDRVRSRGG